jgi:tetratricopeptide (TPR) repeat protein
MNTRIFIIAVFFILSTIKAFSQAPSEEFINGLKQINTDVPAAKLNFLAAVAKTPTFHGSYHFLGVIYLNDHKPDSAIWYLKKAVELNPRNISHTTEFSYSRLIAAYISKQDYENAFAAAWDAYKLFPDSQELQLGLKDATLWAYYTKNNELDPKYSSIDPRDEYVVNNIDEEYLIVRNWRVTDRNLQVAGQSLTNKKGSAYDVLTCSIAGTNDTREIDFKINWDMNKYPGGINGPVTEVSGNKQKSIAERAGAMVVADNKTDLPKAIKKMLSER